MSSATNRGAERIPFDYYPTPPWCVHRLLDRHGRELFRPGVHVLEPTVGDGSIVRAVKDWQSFASLTPEFADCVEWTGVDLRTGALHPDTFLDQHVEGMDFRLFDPWEAGVLGHSAADDAHRPNMIDVTMHLFDLAIGNPPFSLAEPIIQHAVRMANVVTMLLRVDFLGSAERRWFWRLEGADPTIRVLPDRPSFDGKGTDSSTYAWFIWGADLSGHRVEVLDHTPAEIRSAQKPYRPTGIPQIGLDLTTEGAPNGKKAD